MHLRSAGEPKRGCGKSEFNFYVRITASDIRFLVGDTRDTRIIYNFEELVEGKIGV